VVKTESRRIAFRQGFFSKLLGSINRARKVIYEALSKFRHEANGLPQKEPTTIPW
jgi:hypothetical protein